MPLSPTVLPASKARTNDDGQSLAAATGILTATARINGRVAPLPRNLGRVMPANARVPVCLLVALVCCQHAAQAASPSIGISAPVGGQRGTEIEVAFNGANLGDGQEVMFYEPGITTKDVQVVNENQIKAKLTIAPECRLGIHDYRVRTATGISNLRTFHVGALPEAVEAEPNSDFTAPQVVAFNSTINGIVENEDVDYFVIEVAKGTRINAELEGIRLGNFFFDPYVSIMNAGRFELAGSDDAALLRQDCIASLVAPEDGKYIIQVRESAFGGNGSCNYRLHLGAFPRPRAVVPAGGKPGSTLEVRYLGDIAGERAATVTLPTEPSTDFGLFAQDEQGIAPSANVFRLSDLENFIETEPNNAQAQGNPFAAPLALNGVIAEPGDVDCFKFKATKGQVLDIQVYARRIRTPLDPVLYVLASNGGNVAGSDDSAGPDSYLRFTAPADDEYTVMLHDHLRKGGVDYAYRVELTAVQPALTMGLPEQSQFVDIVAPVPRGNRFAFLVSGSRADFGGELAAELRNLPAGVQIETVPMAANQTTVPVLLTAPADAAIAGALVDVVGRWNDPNQKVEGQLSQLTSLIRGQNNVRMWDRETRRMAVSVAEEAPFSIEVIEPKVPLVRGGTMNLKVVAHRKDGFTAPIAVRMLYNPPDVGSAGTITIAEGQNEALIPLNAGGGAEIRPWKIAVLGDAGTARGTVTVASQLATLLISEPYFGFTFQAAAVEQSQETDIVIQVSKSKDFEGAAKVELLGLPHEVTTEPKEITKDSTELVFRLKTTANSPAGKHPTLICRATVIENGEPITHMLGTGELRIDTPLPPKADAPAAPAAAAPMPEQPPEKRLTRLEQLRLDREKAKAERAAAKAAAEAAPATDAPPAAESQPAAAAPAEPPKS
jgi:hypothetical protein